MAVIYYKVRHKYKLHDHIEKKYIGIFSTEENAKAAIRYIKDKKGFIDTPEGFKILKVLRLKAPKLLDKTFWEEGFDTYHY